MQCRCRVASRELPPQASARISAAIPVTAEMPSAGTLHKRPRNLPGAKCQRLHRMPEHSAGQDVQLPPIRTLPSECSPPRLDGLNIRDRSTTPMDIGSPTPKSRKRTFEDDGNGDRTVMIVSPNGTPPLIAQFNPDLDDRPYIYSSIERCSDNNTRVMPVAKPSSPCTESSKLPTPAPTPIQTQLASPTPTIETTAQPVYNMRRQLETRPISEEQLISEVRGIYAGLVMVEKKCMELDRQQASKNTKLSNEQWQALIALHKTLLHEHYDFLLASQHPSASPKLRELANRYAMPARLWKHGILSLLELLRQRLPDTFEHMMAFLCMAYSMMTLLMESVPSSEETWTEYLGHLARYRMAIEKTNSYDREVWAGVARHWYSKVAGKRANSSQRA